MKNNFKFNALLISILTAGLLGVATAAPARAANPAKLETMFTVAMTHYKQGKVAGAYGRFAALADQGHPEAARIALFMLGHGAQMYGSDWGASQPQIDLWTKLANRGVEPLKSASFD